MLEKFNLNRIEVVHPTNQPYEMLPADTIVIKDHS